MLSFAPTKTTKIRHSRWNHNIEVDKSLHCIVSYRIAFTPLHYTLCTPHLRHRITSHIHISNLAFCSFISLDFLRLFLFFFSSLDTILFALSSATLDLVPWQMRTLIHVAFFFSFCTRACTIQENTQTTNDPYSDFHTFIRIYRAHRVHQQ